MARRVVRGRRMLALVVVCSIGAFITFYVGLIAVYDPIRRFGNTFNRLQAMSAATERVFEILDRPVARPDRADAVEAGSVEHLLRERLA